MHINSDAIIHFGHACLSKVSRLPVHYVFMHYKFDAAKFNEAFQKHLPNHDEPILVFYSNGLFYELSKHSKADCVIALQSIFINSFLCKLQIISSQRCLVTHKCHLPNWHLISKLIIWHGNFQKLIYQQQLVFGSAMMIKHSSI